MRKRLALAHGLAVASFRDMRGLSQPALADRTRVLAKLAAGEIDDNGLTVVKVSEAAIGMIESGKRHPSPNTLHTLALALEVPVEAIGRLASDDHARCPHCDGAGMALVTQ